MHLEGHGFELKADEACGRSGVHEERRGWDPRVSFEPAENERELVDVAPGPVLSGFQRADDRVGARADMCCCVAVRRVVAAPDVAAGEADAQVEPSAARAEAVFAPIDRLRELLQ